MKKLFASALGLVSLISVSSASAIVITETYSYYGAGDYNANSTLTEGESINFRFDMFNAGGGATPPASFMLTEDAVNADAITPWLSGSFSMDLYSIDAQSELTALTITAYNGSTLDTMLFEALSWNQSSLADPVYNVSYIFTAAEMTVFDDWGLANVNIVATSTFLGNYNDFAISSVSMSVSDAANVPEPSALLLLGAGILGFGVTSRKRKKY